MSGRWLSSYGGRPHRGLAKFLSRILSRRDDWKLTSRHDVDDLVIVDGKVVSTFTDTHTARMIGYLNITGLKLALLLNFKTRVSPGSASSTNASTRRQFCRIYILPIREIRVIRGQKKCLT